MKYFILAILLFQTIDPSRIARINSAKKDAREAYISGDYKKAATMYQYLSDSLDVHEDEILINLANSYFQLSDTSNATATYQAVSQSDNAKIRSNAQQQLGILNHRQGKMEEALANFKASIKADKDNIDAKYNYEMLKKKLDEEKRKEEEKEKNRPKEPSAYAKRLKAQADNLLTQFRFGEAESLMTEGAKKDQSVLYYEDYMNRIREIVTINKDK
jgi:hypothetical protein